MVKLPAPHLQPVDLEALLRDIALLMRTECERRNIEWDWDIQADLKRITMDENQMEQAFVNILKNAAEAIGADGRINIRLGKLQDRPFAVVEDTGAGINPEVTESLFTPFFSTKENRRGLGLTLVQEILSRHGFAFSLESPPARARPFYHPLLRYLLLIGGSPSRLCRRLTATRTLGKRCLQAELMSST